MDAPRLDVHAVVGTRKPIVYVDNEYEKIPVSKSSYYSIMLSSLVNGVLMIVFCNVFGYIIFAEDFEEFAYLGVAMSVLGQLVGGIITARFSSCRISMVAPHIHPTLFYAACAKLIFETMHHNGVEHTHEMVPTLMMTLCIGTLMVGVTFLVLSFFRASTVVQFLPVSVLVGLLAAIGWTIMVEGVSVSTGVHLNSKHMHELWTWHSWRQLLLALPMGCGLYYCKRNHISKPTIIVPAFVVIPLSVFYIILAISGISVHDARADGWFLENSAKHNFYELYDELWLNIHKVDWSVVGTCMPELLAMIVIVVLDFLLQIAGTEKNLTMNMDFDEELKIAGWFNSIGALFGALPAFSAVKFTLVNYGIIQNKDDPLPGYFASLFCGALFFWGYPIINFFPRFFLGGLVFYAGIGFLVKNLWDARLTFSIKEMLAVWTIVILCVLSQLMIAVLVGILFSFLIFTIQYARQQFVTVKNIAQMRSTCVRPFTHREKLEQLADSTSIFILKGLVFFGSASSIHREVTNICRNGQKLPKFKRLRYLVIDFDNVVSIDSNAANVLLKITLIAQTENFLVLFSGLSDKVHSKLAGEGVVPALEKQPNSNSDDDDDDDSDKGYSLAFGETDTRALKHGENANIDNGSRSFVFQTCDLALEWVEEQLLSYCNVIRAKWLVLSSMKKLNAVAIYTALQSPFDDLLQDPTILDYIDYEQVAPGEVLCRSGELIEAIYLLQAGRVSIYLEHSDGTRKRLSSTSKGACMAPVWDIPSAETIVVEKLSSFLVISKSMMELMEEEAPSLALRVQRSILRDVVTARNRLEHDMDEGSHWDGYEKLMEIRERKMHRNPDLLASITNYYETIEGNKNMNDNDNNNSNNSNSNNNSMDNLNNNNKHQLSIGRRMSNVGMNIPNNQSSSPSIPYTPRQGLIRTLGKNAMTESKDQTNKKNDVRNRDDLIRVTSQTHLCNELIDPVGDSEINTHVKSVPHFYSELYEWDIQIDSKTHPSLAVRRNSLLTHNNHSAEDILAYKDRKTKRRTSLSMEVINSSKLKSPIMNNNNKLNVNVNESPLQSSSSLNSPRKNVSILKAINFTSPTYKNTKIPNLSLRSVDENEQEELELEPLPIFSPKGTERRSNPKSTLPSDKKKKTVQFVDEKSPDLVIDINDNDNQNNQNNIIIDEKKSIKKGLSRSASLPSLREEDILIATKEHKKGSLSWLYCLSRHQRRQYSEYFNTHAIDINKNDDNDDNDKNDKNDDNLKSLKSHNHHNISMNDDLFDNDDDNKNNTNESKLSIKHLRHVLMDFGYYLTQTEVNVILTEALIEHDVTTINLDEFLRIMNVVSMAKLSPLQIRQFHQVFDHYDIAQNGLLTRNELNNLFLQAFGHVLDYDESLSLIREWDINNNGGINFEEFTSMLAYSLKREQLDHDINLSFFYFTNESSEYIKANDLQSALQMAYNDVDIPIETCEEMIWVCSTSQEDKLIFSDYINMITTVYEPGWIVLYNWHRNKPVRFLHDLCDEDQPELDLLEDHELNVEEKTLIHNRAIMGHVIYEDPNMFDTSSTFDGSGDETPLPMNNDNNTITFHYDFTSESESGDDNHNSPKRTSIITTTQPFYLPKPIVSSTPPRSPAMIPTLLKPGSPQLNSRFRI